jgi:predicted hydrocarbon binding protein
MAQIRGFAIRGLFRYAKVRGVAGTAIVAKLPADIKPAFETQILHSELYPYRAFSDVLRVIDRALGAGDGKLARDVGREAAKEDIKGVFQVAALLASPEKAVTGFPDIDPLHCLLIEGWNEGGLDAIWRTKNVKVWQKECVHAGGTRCVFEGSWA